jgi:hypothetical protein
LPKLDFHILKHICQLVVARCFVLISQVDSTSRAKSGAACMSVDQHQFEDIRLHSNRNFSMDGYQPQPRTATPFFAMILTHLSPFGNTSESGLPGIRLLKGNLNEESNYYSRSGQANPYCVT